MDNSQRADMARQLNARFEPGEHEVRSGGGGKWFVYLKREAIIERLDSIAPMDWHTKIVSTERVADRVEVVMEMTIADVTRSFNGVSEDKRRKAKDGKLEVLLPLITAKSAATDAFKRVATMFGIGLYLQGCDTIQASNKGDAFKAFERWYHSNNPMSKQQAGNGKSETIPWPSSKQVMLVMDAFRDDISDSEIFQLAGVKSFDDGDGWRKYKDAQAAVLAMETAFDNVTTSPRSNDEMNATFHYMNYIGKTSNMQFMMNKPGTKNNTVAVLYGGRGAIRKWCGDELCEQLNLAQYDKIKGKNVTSDFIKMVAPIDFYFISENRNGAEYFKITGAVDKPVAAQHAQEPHQDTPEDYGVSEGDNIPF